MVTPIELNLEGLPGPTHNFAGLAVGNLASEQNRFEVSSPRRAALQSLEKMRTLHDLGASLAILPPHERPAIGAMRDLGFRGSDIEVLTKAYAAVPDLFRACYSSSAMWTANAATVSPAADTSDRRVHFTPANLSSQFHRALETPFTTKLLRCVFPEGLHFAHHDPLLACATLRDEGAANHLRLVAGTEKPGVEIFVWGDAPSATRPQRYLARQTLKASQAIARLHGLGLSTLFLQQNPEAIDQGVFHNDVIGVSHGPLLLTHSEAFAEGSRATGRIREAFPELELIEISSAHLTISEAVSTYLFNSQMLDLLDGSIAIVTPEDVAKHPRAKDCLERILSTNNRISKWISVPLNQSMKNGGGPACLRLRVVLSPDALLSMHQGVRFTLELQAKMVAWVEKHYREELAIADLADPLLLEESKGALDELTQILELGSIYSFQS